MVDDPTLAFGSTRQEHFLDDFRQRGGAGLEVEAALRGLPERTRRIFLLNRIHGRTYAEIAQAMQLSQSAVEKHMMRALDACKASLAGPAGEQARSAQP